MIQSGKYTGRLLKGLLNVCVSSLSYAYPALVAGGRKLFIQSPFLSNTCAPVLNKALRRQGKLDAVCLPHLSHIIAEFLEGVRQVSYSVTLLSCALLAGNRMSRVSELCSLDTNSRVVLAVMKFLAHLTLSVEGQKLLVQVPPVSVMSDVAQNDRSGARLGTASDLMCCPSVWPGIRFSVMSLRADSS